MPQEVINKWVRGIPEMVGRIIKHKRNNNFHG
jgi:hypothetical protein